MRNHSVKEFFNPGGIRSRKVETQLEAPPHCLIKQLAMVGRRYDDHIARQLIKLHQKEGDNSLDFAGFMGVAPLFADCIELVKEKNAGTSPNIVEQLAKAGIRLAQIAADQRIIAHNEEGQTKSLRDGLGKGGLAVAGRSGEQYAVAWLISMRAQYISPDMLLNQLPPVLLDGKRQKQLFHTGARLDLQDRILAGPRLD